MNIEPTLPTTKNPPAQFAGDVWLDPIALPAPGCLMEHIAMLQNSEDPATTTTWREHITDDEYSGN